MIDAGAPPPSRDLIRRSLAAETAYTLSRLQVLARIPGNPVGVAWRALDGGAIAMMAKNLPSPSFNSVRGLAAGHASHIAPLVAWYRENAVDGRFEAVPGLFHENVGRELHRLGYYASEFHASTVAAAGAAPQTSGGAIERVTDAAAMEAFLDAYVAGWEFPPEHHAQFKANVRPWLHAPGWSLYVAHLDGRPAAAAVLYLHDKVGCFADSATDPRFRGRGLQTALLARRWQDARAAGADIVCSGAALLSASHRNMERLGMRLQFTRAIWTACPTTC
ncbi:MAG TPA: GNAT family N-acetyltransferase [Xanthobacteraceae bacterium]|nr:GNAT family N-acetyltransferase [Xanthobacteraceae bacterium]